MDHGHTPNVQTLAGTYVCLTGGWTSLRRCLTKHFLSFHCILELEPKQKNATYTVQQSTIEFHKPSRLCISVVSHNAARLKPAAKKPATFETCRFCHGDLDGATSVAVHRNGRVDYCKNHDRLWQTITIMGCRSGEQHCQVESCSECRQNLTSFATAIKFVAA